MKQRLAVAGIEPRTSQQRTDCANHLVSFLKTFRAAKSKFRALGSLRFFVSNYVTKLVLKSAAQKSINTEHHFSSLLHAKVKKPECKLGSR